MALIKGFDPSKQFKVVKTFFEGGRKFQEGDVYDPQTKLGQSKKLFRHYVAKRIVPIVEEQKPAPVVPEVVSNDTEEKATAGDSVQQESSEDKPAPKRRRKKQSDEDSE